MPIRIEYGTAACRSARLISSDASRRKRWSARLLLGKVKDDWLGLCTGVSWCLFGVTPSKRAGEPDAQTDCSGQLARSLYVAGNIFRGTARSAMSIKSNDCASEEMIKPCDFVHGGTASTSQQTAPSSKPIESPLVSALSEVSNARIASGTTLPRASHHPKVPAVHLNCKASFPDKPLQMIACRHLSAWWMKSFLENGGKADYEKVSSVTNIMRHVPSSTEEEHEYRGTHSRMELVESRKWGARIAREFKDMDEHQDPLRVLSVLSLTHAMALGLRVKNSSEDGHRDYVVKFYDPNDTARHTRVIKNTLGEVHGLAAHDFVATRNHAVHEDGVLGFLGRAHETTDVAEGWSPQLPAGPTPATFAHLLGSGFKVMPYYEELVKLSVEKQLEVLKAKPGQTFGGGLARALANGHATAIKDFGALLERLGVSRMDAYRVLESNAGKGLGRAIAGGHSEADRKSVV